MWLLFRIKHLWDSLSKELKYSIALFLSTRILLSIIGVIARISLKPFVPYHPDWLYSNYLILDIWGIWDSGWYLNIVSGGYTPINAEHITAQSNIAFFPFYPMLIKFLSMVTGDHYISGLLISNTCLIFTGLVLYRLIKLDYDEEIARKSVKYMYLFPTAFILSGLFAESLCLFLIVSSFYLARKQKWLPACFAGFSLALTRSLGVLICIPLFVEYCKQREFDWKKIDWKVFYLALIPLGLCAFALYNYALTGDFFAFLKIQTIWGRESGNPIAYLWEGLTSPNIYDWFLASFGFASLMLLASFYRKIRLSYMIFGLYSIFVPLCSGLWSLPRLVLIVFPLYMIFALITHTSESDQFFTISLSLLQGAFMVLWAIGLKLIV